MIEEVRICPVCSREFGESASTCPQDGVALMSLETGSTDRAESRVGQVVAGRYRLERVVGRGGMGTVYACRQVLVGKTFAMKVLRPGVERSTEVLARFIREAQAANAVQSRHICETVDFGQLDNGAFYVVMELLDGMSLTRALREGRLDPTALRDVFVQIAETLERAHRAGIVHRDLKPDNVILVREEEHPYFVKLVDFGIAKVLQSEASNLTETGIILGTPYYMSPEQARGEPVDARSDIYALGVMMYRAFTGKLPFVADTAMGVLTRHLTETPELPSRVAAVDPVTERVILRCMEKRAIDRFQSMSDVATALRSVAEQPPRSDDRATIDDRGSSGMRAALHAQLERDGLGHLITPPPASHQVAQPGAMAPGLATAAHRAASPALAPSPGAGWHEVPSQPVLLGAPMPGAPTVPGSYAGSSPYGPAGTGPHQPPAMGSGAYVPHGATGPSGALLATPVAPGMQPPLPARSGIGMGMGNADSAAASWHGPTSAPFGRADLGVEAFTARGVVSSRIDTRASAVRSRRLTVAAGVSAALVLLAAGGATAILLGRPGGSAEQSAESADAPSVGARAPSPPPESERDGRPEPAASPPTAEGTDAGGVGAAASAVPTGVPDAVRPGLGADAGPPRPTATYRPPPPKPTSDIRSPFE